MMMMPMMMMMMTMMINSHQTMEVGGQVVTPISLNVKQDHAHCVHLVIMMNILPIMIIKVNKRPPY